MLDIHVVSHTHWDREWYLTHEQFRFRLVALVDRLLDLLDRDPSYKYFHLDGQTIVLEDYLEIRPEQEPRLRQAIASGRVLIGPWYVMPDEFLVSGESLVRNLMRGHRIARTFGTPMPVGYLPDLFGHVGQMPQIWRHFGLDNTILWRGFGGSQAEYWWQAPDGSRVLMLHLPPEGYCNATRIVFAPEAMMDRAAEKVGFERARTATGQALLMNGVDHVEPHVAIPALVERLSSVDGQRAAHSTLPAYVAAVRTAVEQNKLSLETVTGELRGGTDYANLLPGVLSARVYLKQHNARVQRLLESYAEPLSVFASMLGERYPAGELRYAWKVLLQNHPHDSICGCSVDAVHEENMIRFARAEQVARAILDRALDTISDSVVPAPPSIIRVVAVNTDVRRADHVIEASIDLPVDSAEPWRTVDAQALDRPVVFWPESASIRSVTAVDGSAVPFQILDEERVVTHVMSRYETPWALNSRRIRLLWRAPELPSCGYSAFDLEIGTVVPAAPPPEDERSAENEHLRLVVDDRGRFDVVDKRTGTQYRNIAAIEDVGDVGDEYNYSPPRVDRRITTADAQLVGVARSVAGPLRTILRVEFELPLPRRASADRTAREGQTTVNRVVIEASLDAGAPRVALRVTIDNQADDHRLRLLFPTGADAVATARADTAFDVVTRPARVPVPAVVKNEAPVSSAPMISVVDAGDGGTGATIIASGLMEYEVVGSDGGDAIALTLLRAVGDLSRNDLVTRPSGHAGPPVATPGAQCRGPHHFELAFQPRAQPPAAGELLAASRAHWIQPQIAVVRRPDGKGPVSRSFLDADVQGAVVLSALKRAEDREAVIVRVFNPNDGDAVVSLKSPHARRAHAVDCLEERQRELPVAGDGAVVVGLGPHRIETVELEG